MGRGRAGFLCSKNSCSDDTHIHARKRIHARTHTHTAHTEHRHTYSSNYLYTHTRMHNAQAYKHTYIQTYIHTHALFRALAQCCFFHQQTKKVCGVLHG